MLLACETIGKGNKAFHHFGFNGGAQFPLLNGKGAFFGRDSREGIVIHTARLEDGEHLAGGVEIQRQVVGIVKADDKPKGEDKDERCNPRCTGSEK